MPIQKLLQAKALIEEALPDETPEARVQFVGLLLLGPAMPDTLFHRQPVQAGSSKADQLVDMLKRPKGVTLNEVIKTFGIKKNSAYARISVVARKAKLRVKHEGDRYLVA